MKTIRTFFAIAALCLGMESHAQAPFSFDDGLERSTPEAQGVSSRAIADFFQALEDGGYEVHGLMLMRHDKVIAEHWWYPYGPDHKHAMYSSTKTFSAMAMGFAVQEGLVKVSDKVKDIFPDLVPANPAPELDRLTVKHLLSMTTGHRSTQYEGSGDDQVRSFLAMDYAHEPGTSFAYNITNSHMLSQIISRVTGETIYEYLKPRLLDKIGISDDVFWEMDLSGRNMGNGGMHSRTSDMAKFGTFMKNRGKWNGEQIIDPQWIDDMTATYIYQNPQRSAEENANDDGSQGYGYQTWMGRHNSYRAIGASNQVILVIPDCDVVLASQGSIGDENGFNSLVYKLCDTMSDKKLKADKGFDLNAAISGYALKFPFPACDESNAVKNCTKRYNMHQNSYGINVVDFRFDKSGNVYLTFEGDAFTTNIPFGLNSWKMGQTDRKAAFARAVYTNMMGVTPYETAGYCTWTAENELTTYYLSMFNVGTNETFRFSFDGDDITMTIVGPAGRGGAPAQSVVLTGSAIKKTVKTTPF